MDSTESFLKVIPYGYFIERNNFIMGKKILITAETGSDITQELARALDVVLIPMHVSLGNETLDDGTFPPEDICSYYDRTGKVPT